MRVAGLTVSYGRRAVLEDLTGEIAAASLMAVVGPNGAGKSTFLKVLVGIVRPQAGKIDRSASAGRIAYLPQQNELDRDFPITIGELVALGGWRSFGAFRPPPDGVASGTAQALAAVGLEGMVTRPIAEVSPGLLQRALFARLIMQDAGTILLDEPFLGIDEETTADLLALIRRWHEEKRTVVAVLHDLEQVRGYFPTTLLLARRAIAWGETARALTPENLAAARAAIDGRRLRGSATST